MRRRRVPHSNRPEHARDPVDVDKVCRQRALDLLARREHSRLELERKLRQANFDLEDFAQQLQQLKKMGPLSQIVEMIPGFSGIKNRMPSQELDEGSLTRVESIIYSMTPEERRRPEIIGGGRRRRIARGSGTAPQDVNQLLNQFRQMQKLMRQMASGKGLGNLMRIMQ